jgi:Fe-S-cluster containining protein
MKKILHLSDELPLTCSRKGTCCHGNQVLLNPWELVSLAHQLQIDAVEFRKRYCDFFGFRLRFDGAVNSLGNKACLLYQSETGCTVHKGRPLACRLFPLGRQIQQDTITYMFEGSDFPCNNGCSEVNFLPKLSVESYLKEQKTTHFEAAQDAYLEVAQSIADIAFMLLLETCLAESNDTETLQEWLKLGKASPQELAKKIGTNWIDLLTIPILTFEKNNPTAFIEKHLELLQHEAQLHIDSMHDLPQFRTGSIQFMAMALLVAKSVGANPEELAELWIATAREHGAKG